MMDVNWLAVFAAGIINMIVGSLWYSPLMFQKPWMATLKLSEKKAGETNMGKTYSIMFVNALVTGYVMAMLVRVTNAMTIDMGAVLGFWIWLGFVATSSLNGVLFEQKSLKGYFINAGYYLVVLVIVGAMMAVWR